MLENSLELKIQVLDLDQILDKIQNKDKEYSDDDKWVRMDNDEAIYKEETYQGQHNSSNRGINSRRVSSFFHKQDKIDGNNQP